MIIDLGKFAVKSGELVRRKDRIYFGGAVLEESERRIT